jgi:bifunctional DNA-binding transcriptional regulator/antitoxin component of YhaV-PrlF toxin-antitoxin module
MITTLTTKGQTVVPAALRRRFKMGQKTRLNWTVEGDTIRVVPIPDDTLAAARGMFAAGSSLTAALLRERRPAKLAREPSRSPSQATMASRP